MTSNTTTRLATLKQQYRDAGRRYDGARAEMRSLQKQIDRAAREARELGK